MEEENKKAILKKVKSILKKWSFWTAIAILIISIILMIILNKPKFEIDSFDIEKKITEFQYSNDTVTYSGEGEIRTKDKKNMYLVALKKVLIEGGNEDTEYYDFLEDGKKCTVTSVLVCNGKGSFSTYDYGDVAEIDRPEYDFEILGYLKLNNL